jgi:chromosome segregation ATPase
VAIKPALNNSVSTSDLMNCPKCGYAQEKRLDCKKCGIVFSKYYALYPPTQAAAAADATSAANPNPPDPSGQDVRAALTQIQLQLQTFTGRFSEVEFERAERSQLRIDLKNLERQIRESIARVESRLTQTEKSLQNPPAPPAQPAQQSTPDIRVMALTEKLERVEEKLGSFDFATQSIVSLGEKNEANSRQVEEIKGQLAALQNETKEAKGAPELISQAQKQVSDLQNQFTALQNEVKEVKSAPELVSQAQKQVYDLQNQLTALQNEVKDIRTVLDQVAQAQKEQEPRTPIEQDVHIIRKNMDELRQFLNSFSKNQ